MDKIIDIVDSLQKEIKDMQRTIRDYQQVHESLLKDLEFRTNQVKELELENAMLREKLCRGVDDGK